MLPSACRRAPHRHGQRIRTCCGVSASSPHTWHRAAGQSVSAQPGQSAVGRRPIRWRYWVDSLQWPARSWWMSTAASRLSVRTGVGRVCSVNMDRYQPSGQLSCQERRMVLATARVMLRTSRGRWSGRARRPPLPARRPARYPAVNQEVAGHRGAFRQGECRGAAGREASEPVSERCCQLSV